MVPRRITVHCSATPNGETLDIDTVRAWHKMRGWRDVGYHMMIDIDGRVDQGRPLNEVGAHVEGENEGNLGVCLVGSGLYTKAQWDSLRRQLDSLFMTFTTINKWELHCHYEFKSAQAQGKSCPNVPINRLLRWYWLNDEGAIAEHMLVDTPLGWKKKP